MAIGEGHGSTVTFGTSGYSANIVSIDGPSIERGTIDTSYLSTADNYRTFIPTTLVDGGTLDLTVQYDPTLAPPVTGAVETITITFGSAAVGIAFSGFVTTFNPTASLDELMTASMGIKATGALTFDTTI